MDHVLNLLRMLKKLGKKILVELSYHYIKQKEEQTTKRHDNSSSTTSLQNPLTVEDQRSIIQTSCPDTSEKITMETQIEPLQHIRDWSIERIHELAEGDLESQFNAVAIAEEFDEWINFSEDEREIHYLVLESEEWTEDQEIDTI